MQRGRRTINSQRVCHFAMTEHGLLKPRNSRSLCEVSGVQHFHHGIDVCLGNVLATVWNHGSAAFYMIFKSFFWGATFKPRASWICAATPAQNGTEGALT